MRGEKNTKDFPNSNPRVRRVTCRRTCGCLLRRRGRIRPGKRRRNLPASGRRRGRVPSPSMSRWIFSDLRQFFSRVFLMIADFGSRLQSKCRSLSDPNGRKIVVFEFFQRCGSGMFFPGPIFSFPDSG